MLFNIRLYNGYLEEMYPAHWGRRPKLHIRLGHALVASLENLLYPAHWDRWPKLRIRSTLEREDLNSRFSLGKTLLLHSRCRKRQQRFCDGQNHLECSLAPNFLENKMRTLGWILLDVLIVVAFCVLVLNEPLREVLLDVVVFYSIIAVVGAALLVYIGLALTKAMNPRRPN